MTTNVDLKSLHRRARLSVATLFFLLAFGGANWLARVPVVRRELGLNDRQLGLLLLCCGVGAVASLRTAAFWLARVESRQLAVASTIAIGALLWVPAATSSPLLAGLALAASGYACGLLDIGVNANGVLVERAIGKPILASLHGCCSLGSAAGAACGTLAAACGMAPAPHLAVVGAATALLAWAVRSHLLPDERAIGAAAEPARFTSKLVLLGAIAFCSSVGEGGMAQWSAVYLQDELHTSETLAGAGFSIYCASMMVGRLLGDRLTGHWPAPALFVRCGLLASTSLVAALVIASPVLSIFCFAGVGLGLSLVIPAVFRSATALPRVRPASALAAVATLSYGGFLFGPPTIGLLAQELGLRLGLGVIVLLAITMAALGQRVPSAKPNAAADEKHDIVLGSAGLGP